ncbi:nicotinate-nucleotide--dimethylbenzimidazole phosphoribosyltransferase [Streptomyces sp. NPDC002640]
MTDTGQVPGDGLPESAGTVEQPGVPTPGSYPYLSAPTAEEEDLLLPGAQGAWGNEVAPAPEGGYPEGAYADGGYPEQHPGHEPHPGHEQHPGHEPHPGLDQHGYAEQQVYAQQRMTAEQQAYAQPHAAQQAVDQAVQQEAAGQVPPAGPEHTVPEQGLPVEGAAPYAPEGAGQTSHATGVHDSGSYDLGAAAQAPGRAASPRRPLHLGPPTPDASMSPVRSLADRGPATVVRQLGQQAPGAEYPDPQGGASAQHHTPWAGVPTGQAAAQASPEQHEAQPHAGQAYATAGETYPAADASLGAGLAHAAGADPAAGPYEAAAQQQAYPGQETAAPQDTFGGQQTFDGQQAFPAAPQETHAGQDAYAAQDAALRQQTYPNDTLSGQGTLGGGQAFVGHEAPAHGADASGQFAVTEPLGEFVPVPGTVPTPPHLAPGHQPAPAGEAWPAQAPDAAEPVTEQAGPEQEFVPEQSAGGQPAEQAAAEQPAQPEQQEQHEATAAEVTAADADAPVAEQAPSAPEAPAEEAPAAPAEQPEQPQAPEAPVAVVPAPREGERMAAPEPAAEAEAAEEPQDGTADAETPQAEADFIEADFTEPGATEPDVTEAPQADDAALAGEPRPEPAPQDDDQARAAAAEAADTVPAQAASVDDAAPAEAPHASAEEALVEEALVEEAPEEEAPEAEPQPPAPGYAESEREAVLRVMRERRDIRQGFRPDPIPHEVLRRVLEAAHHAPSVGHSQPWDFVVIRSEETRQQMHELAMRQREAYAKSLPKGRAKQFKQMKIEAILDTPVNIVVTADPTRGGRHTLGRHTQPQMAPYSAALAVENLWLAARAEGLGVGWVSFFDEREMVRSLGLPEYLEVVAYLCVGYVDEFPDEPELVQAGWSKRRPLSWAVHEETYGRRALPGEDPHDLLAETIAGIRPLDAKALGEAWERQKRMTKPAGALGMLEIISAQLCGLSRQCPPPIPEPAAVAVFAGDHGVHAQGVTPWPQEVTAQMVANMLGGGAVSNAFATQVGAELCVVDVGVAAELPAQQGLLPRKVRPGTADMTQGPAMTREEAKAAIEVGIETARDLVAAGNKALLTGEMGIANTTASAALIAVFTGTDPAEVTGRGTGIDDETLARKTDVVRHALELHQPDPADPIGVLAAVGGLEHAAMVGLLLGGACLRTPVILDGVSAGAAALVARAIAPEVLAACIAGHRSAEPGHVAALNKLGLRPLVDLDLRLGEGTGALLALPLVQSTARAMHEVATFDSAGVTEK